MKIRDFQDTENFQFSRVLLDVYNKAKNNLMQLCTNNLGQKFH